jgi:hypothetical protein
MTYFTAIFWLGGFAVGADHQTDSASESLRRSSVGESSGGVGGRDHHQHKEVPYEGMGLGERARGLLMAFVFALGVPALSQAQLFPVSADVATVRADLLLWATALIGVALAIYAFKRVRAIVG